MNDLIEEEITRLEQGETTRRERNIFRALRLANNALLQFQTLSREDGGKVLATVTRGEMHKALSCD